VVLVRVMHVKVGQRHGVDARVVWIVLVVLVLVLRELHRGHALACCRRRQQLLGLGLGGNLVAHVVMGAVKRRLVRGRFYDQGTHGHSVERVALEQFHLAGHPRQVVCVGSRSAVHWRSRHGVGAAQFVAACFVTRAAPHRIGAAK
jgi:hypothetical protein